MFEVGDKVKVIAHQEYCNQMAEFDGKICTIRNVIGDWCELKESIFFTWYKDWLEPYEDFNINEQEIKALFGE